MKMIKQEFLFKIIYSVTKKKFIIFKKDKSHKQSYYVNQLLIKNQNDEKNLENYQKKNDKIKYD